MTESEALRQICSYNSKWESAFKNEDINYILIADIGREIVEDVLNKKHLKRVEKVFLTVESILEKADIGISSLIGTGMFEAMQNVAYSKLNPPDSMDRYLGLRSIKLWRDIIEGCTGQGIRTIEHWRRVLVNGKISSFRMEFLETKEAFELKGKRLKMISPLIATKFIGWKYTIEVSESMGFSKPYAIIKIKQPSRSHLQNTDILIGAKSKEYPSERYATSDNAIVTFDIQTIESLRE